MAPSKRTETYLQRRLRERRKTELGLSQQELAEEAVGVQYAVVQRLEQGQTEDLHRPNRLALARALRWEDDWLAKLKHGEEPEERTDDPAPAALAPQLQSILALSHDLDEPVRQKALNEALRAFVAALNPKGL